MRSALYTVLICLFFGFGLKSEAQQTIYDEATVIFTKSLQGGIHAHPRGWGLNFAYGDIKTVDKTVLYGIEILGMKHSKEVKQFNAFYEDAKGYAYGKLNAFYVVRPTISIKKVLTDKYRKGGVEVSLRSGIGPVLGFTKPIFLEIIRPIDQNRFTLRTEKYDPEVHGVNNIYGKASALQGFDQLKIWPGVHARSSLYFELSPYQSQLKGLEVGAGVDAYLEEIPLMAFEENNQLFFSFFINLFIGKKFNRSISE